MIKLVVRNAGLKETIKMLREDMTREPMEKTLDLLASRLKPEMHKSLEKNFSRVSRYTKNSLFIYNSKKGTPVHKMNIYAGSFSPYLRDLEDGFTPEPFAIKVSKNKKETHETGRWIASKISRKEDGSIKRGYMIGRMSDIFILKISGEEVGFRRVKSQGKKMQRVRTKKDAVKPVKPYRWIQEAIDKVYNPQWIKKTFFQFLHGSD